MSPDHFSWPDVIFALLLAAGMVAAVWVTRD